VNAFRFLQSPYIFRKIKYLEKFLSLVFRYLQIKKAKHEDLIKNTLPKGKFLHSMTMHFETAYFYVDLLKKIRCKFVRPV